MKPPLTSHLLTEVFLPTPDSLTPQDSTVWPLSLLLHGSCLISNHRTHLFIVTLKWSTKRAEALIQVLFSIPETWNKSWSTPSFQNFVGGKQLSFIIILPTRAQLLSENPSLVHTRYLDIMLSLWVFRIQQWKKFLILEGNLHAT